MLSHTRLYSKYSGLMPPSVQKLWYLDTPVDGSTTISSESVCQAARSWMDVGSLLKRLVVRFMIFTASVRNILETTSYALVLFFRLLMLWLFLNPRQRILVSLSCKSRSLLYAKLYYISLISTTVMADDLNKYQAYLLHFHPSGTQRMRGFSEQRRTIFVITEQRYKH
jgi:hypothetical protein